VRHRPYVRGILSLYLSGAAPHGLAGKRYYTSALAHDLQGRSARLTQLSRQPNLSLPQPSPTAPGGAA
jgi:hypothetical protein